MFFSFFSDCDQKDETIKLFKKELNKSGFEILLNIQIICFLKDNLIDKYLKFLENNLKSSNKVKLYKLD